MALALSTYWMRGRWERVADFVRGGAALGFTAFEISGLLGDTFYDEIRPGQVDIVSFHNPAPPVRGAGRPLGGAALRAAGIILASLDDARRQAAVNAAAHCLDVAAEYGARAVVLHLGATAADPELEAELKREIAAAQKTGLAMTASRADALRGAICQAREAGRGARMTALRHSLDTLIPHAAARGVRLGLENRPICEIPSFTDMGEILGWYDDAAVGYWHDTGHAQVQQALGFTPQADWLRAYGRRLVGVHLHDEVGLAVHRPPGTGNVTWRDLAPLIPDNVVRTVEVEGAVSEEALSAGIRHLAATGWPI